MTEWARLVLLALHRWLPDRSIVAVMDGEFAALELLHALRPSMVVITRLPRSEQRPIPDLATACVPALAEALQDTREGIRRCAASALGQIGLHAADAALALAAALRDTNEAAGQSTVDALKTNGPAGVASLTAVMKQGDNHRTPAGDFPRQFAMKAGSEFGLARPLLRLVTSAHSTR